MDNIKIQDILILILIIAVVYLLFKINSMTTCNENFDTSDNLNKFIEPIKNLGDIAGNLINNKGSLIIPANNTTMPGNLNIEGNLVIDGEVKFTSKNTNLMDIFPKYMVISWANPVIPKGWAECNGTNETPDLRDRFIMGRGGGEFGQYGGEENVRLKATQMPPHNHTIGTNCASDENCNFSGRNNITWESYGSGPSSVPQYQANGIYSNNIGTPGIMTTTLSGGWHYALDGQRSDPDVANNRIPETESFSIIPPFYTLIYIMKL